MRKLSRVLSMVLAFAMLLTCVSVPAFAADKEAASESKKKTIEDYPEVAYLMDANSKKSIEAVKGLKAVTTNTNENDYAGEWKMKDAKSISFKEITDINGYDTIEFYLYGDKDHPASLRFTVWANNPDSDGSDYYDGGLFEVKPGWNKYSYKIADLKPSRTPKTRDNIDYVCLWGTGWGLDEKNDFENTVMYVDSVKLIRGEALLDVPVEKIPETEAGTAKYFDFDFEVENTKELSGASLHAKDNEIKLNGKKGEQYLSIIGKGTEKDCFVDIKAKNTKRYMVISGDFMVENIDKSTQLMTVKDSNDAQTALVNITKDLKLTGGDSSYGTVEQGKWFNVTACCDWDNHTYNVYVDGKLVKENVKMNNQTGGRVALYRAFVMPGGTSLHIDNLRMFDGKVPEDYEKAVDAPGAGTTTTAPESTKVIDVNTTEVPAYVQVKSNAVAEVADAVCLKVNSPFALVRHQQMPIDANNSEVAPFVINGRTLVPVRFISEAFGAEVAWDDATRTVTVTKGSDVLKLVIGSNILNKNGTDITIDVPAEIYYDRTMLPLRAVTENLGKKVFWDDMGLIIISDNEINFTKENDLDKMLDIMSGFIYERPASEKIKADVLARTPGHPRILATADDFARIREYMTYDENIQNWVSKIISTANNYVAAAPDESEHIYKPDTGGRIGASYNIVAKAKSMGMAYQLTGDKKYVDAIWYTLKDMCDRTKWQHWHPGHFLNAADVMIAVSIAYDWMYDAWTPEQKTIIEEALYDCGIEDSITAYHGADNYLSPPMGLWHRSGWWKAGSNWNAHCNAGVVIVGLAMMDHEKYGDLAAKCTNYGINGLEVGLRCYAPDGGYEEGPAYWSYGTNSAVMLMEALNVATGSSYGLSDAPGFADTYATGVYSESKLAAFNYSDNSESRTDTSTLFWYGNEYNLPQVSGIRYNELLAGEKSSSYFDVLWYRPENIDKSAGLVTDYSFFRTDTATMRSSWTDKNQIFLGLHGGDNSVNHSHLDSGSFVFDALGVRWFSDIGSDNYNLSGYWTNNATGRWQYYRLRAEGHNTFVVNPGKGEDQIYKSLSPMSEFVTKPRGAYAKVDLTPAYANDVAKATRGAMLTANRKAAVIQDEITMKAPSEFYWFAHTKAEVEISPDGKSAILSTANGAKKLHVALVTDDANLKFDVMDAVSLPTSPVPTYANGEKEDSRAGIRKLVIHSSGIEKVNIAVVMQPMLGDAPEYTYTYTPLDSWNITDGPIYVPTLTDIKVSGTTVEGFNSSLTNYEIVLPYGTTAVPEVSVTADAISNAQVTLPASLPGTASVKVMNNEDPSMYSLYNVFMRAAGDIELEVSDAQEGNPGEQCLDKDLSTRWAVENDAWGIFNFANPKTISSVWIATWKAAERKLIFDIEVSEDGVNFTQVWSGQSAINTDTLEEFKIPEGTYKAVKLVLHGTTTGSWNSLLEVEFK